MADIPYQSRCRSDFNKQGFALNYGHLETGIPGNSASVARWEGPTGGKFGTRTPGHIPTTRSAQSQAVAEHWPREHGPPAAA